MTATATFAGLALALLALNDRVEDNLPRIDVEQRLTRILSQAQELQMKVDQVLALFKASRVEESLKNQVTVSNVLAMLALVLAVLPLFFDYLSLGATLEASSLLYEVCSILVILSAVFNRVASRRIKDVSLD
jgi:hypothetical protein